MVEQDSYDGTFYWSEKEITRRIVGTKRDIKDMVETLLITVDNENNEYKEGYLDAVDDYTQELEFIFHNRFNEIMTAIQARKLESQKRSEEIKK